MIVTVTANPALDRTVTLVAPLRAGEVQTAVAVREDAGGKGVNVVDTHSIDNLQILLGGQMQKETPIILR